MTDVIPEPLAADIEAVRSNMRRFGFEPKCYAVTSGDCWIMVYHHHYGVASRCYWLGVYQGQALLYRHPFGSDMAARKEFERRVEEAAL